MTASCDDLSSTTVANGSKGVKPKKQRRCDSSQNHRIFCFPIPKLGIGTIPA
jgi:hypothetical protein